MAKGSKLHEFTSNRSGKRAVERSSGRQEAAATTEDPPRLEAHRAQHAREICKPVIHAAWWKADSLLPAADRVGLWRGQRLRRRRVARGRASAPSHLRAQPRPRSPSPSSAPWRGSPALQRSDGTGERAGRSVSRTIMIARSLGRVSGRAGGWGTMLKREASSRPPLTPASATRS